jgi:spermidine synthase
MQSNKTKYLSTHIFKFFFIAFLFLLCRESSNLENQEINYQKSNTKDLVFEVKSKYSHIKIIDFQNIRTLLFVRDNGEEVVESQINPLSPEKLILNYTQNMFSFLLLRNNLPKDVLLVGLGGGGMLHFKNFYFPEISMDTVEIDPKIIEIAGKFFFIKSSKNNTIIEEDIQKYLKTNKKLYDIILMDAFLKPSVNTDETGISLSMKTNEFYTLIKNNLNGNGIVVFNINFHTNWKKDIQGIQSNFRYTTIVQKKTSGNTILFASDSNWNSESDRKKMAEWIDSDRKPNFSFKDLTSYFKNTEEVLSKENEF